MGKIPLARHIFEEAKFRLAWQKPLEIKMRGGNRVKVLFHFNAHRNARDAKDVAPLVKKFNPHIVCFEDAYSDPLRARALVELQRMPELLRPGYDRALAKAIQHVPKIVVLENFDPGAAQQLGHCFDEADVLESKALISFYTGDPRGAFDNLKASITKRTAAHVIRETNVKTNLSRLIDNAKRSSEFKDEKEIRILVNYGGTHTPIYSTSQLAASKGRAMVMPYHFSAVDEAIHHTTFGKPKEPTERELSNILVRMTLATYALSLGVNRSNANSFGSVISRRVDLDTFHKLSETYSEVVKAKQKGIPAFIGVFKKHGIEVPASKFGVHTFLREHRIPLARE